MELSKLDQDKAHIQITYVEPYFDNYGKIKMKKCCFLTFDTSLNSKLYIFKFFIFLNVNTRAQKKKS